MSYNFRKFIGNDESQIVPLWNQCLVRDPISLNTFRSKILLDDNFDSNGCIIAEDGKKIVGFIHSIRRRFPYYGIGLEKGTGWITALFVHPDERRKGVAKELMRRSEMFLAGSGVEQILISSYTPNYFIPGIDIDSYSEAKILFQNLNYKRIEKVYSMGRSLLDFYLSEEMEKKCRDLEKQNIRITKFDPKYIIGLLEFLRKDYPGDLFRLALERLRSSSEYDDIFLAVDNNDDVVGFSHFKNEHFGPFAISSRFGGRGIGACLYYRTALSMKEKGERKLWLAWTSGHSKDFYHKMGLKVLRRHEILKKII
jgi:predicted N-acetyltransferase YhbS